MRSVLVTRIEIGSPGAKVAFHGRHRAGISLLSQLLPEALSVVTPGCPPFTKIGTVMTEVSGTRSAARTFREVLSTRVLDHRAASQAHGAGNLAQAHPARLKRLHLLVPAHPLLPPRCSVAIYRCLMGHHVPFFC